MILEKITIGGLEYFQWTFLGAKNTVGDLFSDWRDIEREKLKLKEQLHI